MTAKLWTMAHGKSVRLKYEALMARHGKSFSPAQKKTALRLLKRQQMLVDVVETFLAGKECEPWTPADVLKKADRET